MIDDTEFSERLKLLRKQKGYSLDELARLMEGSKSYLWELENNRKHSSSCDFLSRLANCLDVDLNYLVNGETINREEVFLHKYRKLTEKQQRQLTEIMNIL